MDSRATNCGKANDAPYLSSPEQILQALQLKISFLTHEQSALQMHGDFSPHLRITVARTATPDYRKTMHGTPVPEITSRRRDQPITGSQWLEFSLHRGYPQAPPALQPFLPNAQAARLLNDFQSLVLGIPPQSGRQIDTAYFQHPSFERPLYLVQPGDKTPDLPPRRLLPGPSESPQLSADEQQRVGWARWPSEEEPTPNPAYSRSMFEASRAFGKLIAQGEVRSFRTLWLLARAWRTDPQRGGVDLIDLDAEKQREFSLLRDAPSQTPIESDPRYQHLMPLTPVVKPRHSECRRLGARVDTGAINDPAMKEVETATAFEFDGEAVALTNINMVSHLREVDGEQRIIHLRGFQHTDPQLIEALLDVCEQRYQRLLQPMQPFGEVLNLLADIHWLGANAMPDMRGSAAKIELCIRAIAAAHGVDLPPFKAGVIPDLEAMVPPPDYFGKAKAIDEFVDRYPTMFERKPELASRSGSQRA